MPEAPALPKPSKNYMNKLMKVKFSKIISDPLKAERAATAIERFYRRRKARWGGKPSENGAPSTDKHTGAPFLSGKSSRLRTGGKKSRRSQAEPSPSTGSSGVLGDISKGIGDLTRHVSNQLDDFRAKSGGAPRPHMDRGATFTSLVGTYGHNAMTSLATQHNDESDVLSSQAKWFLQRLVLVALLTFLTPFLNNLLSLTKGASSHGHGVEVVHEAGAHAVTGVWEVLNHFGTPYVRGQAADEHGHGAVADEHGHGHGRLLSEHGGAHGGEHGGEHGGHGHGDTHILDQLVAFGIVVGLVLVTIGFEYAKDYIEENLKKYAVVLDRVWAELTVLGFLALMTFLMVESGVLPILSALIYGDAEHLVHLFERIHFALFAVMVLFLVGALWLLVAANHMRKQWEDYEQLIRSLVQAVEAGQQSGQQTKKDDDAGDNPTLDLGEDGQIKTTGFTLCETLYEHALKVAPVGFWAQICGLIKLDPAVWMLPQAKDRCVFQRIRQRFMWYAGRSDPSNPLPADFQFADYLLVGMRDFLAHSMEVGIATWVRSIGVMLLIFSTAAAFPKYAIFAQTVAGFAMLAQGALMLSHYDWVLMQLVPVREVDDGEELARYAKWPTFWSKLYNRYLCPDKKVRRRARYGSKDDEDDGASDLSDLEGTSLAEDTIQREHRRISWESSNRRGGLFAGAYERMQLSAENSKFGRTKQTSLLFPPHGKAHGKTAADRQHAASEPLQKWLQATTMLSALYLTVLILFHEPMECAHFFCWDWTVALAVFPILNLMILQVPNALPSMIIAVSVEMLTQQTLVKKILETMKLVKFARTAKLMQAMQTRAGRMAEKKSASGRVTNGHRTGATDFRGLLTKLTSEQRIRAMQLKECFDVFDDTGEGLLDASELESLFAVAGIPLEPHQQEQMMEILDGDGDGVCSLVEWCEYMIFSQQMNDMPPVETAEKIFDMIDSSGDGNLDTEELRDAFERMHTGLSVNELTQVINMFDADNSGTVERSEFVEMMVQIFEEYKL